LYYCAKQEQETREKKVVIIFRQERKGQHIKKNAIIINTGLLLSTSADKLKRRKWRREGIEKAF
jgi:hypothetical protein